MAQSSLIDNFVTGLEYALGTTRTIISLADQWRLECPDGNDNADLAEYLRLKRETSTGDALSFTESGF
ncbi:uncharacterized protein J4E84_000757 [Alternaria hordeiaustralica]|uniref:uncharacterized protein n=1 Tax=Alternaria hordeiaustralica TaxID=1187925 RepID=UPI0020C3CFB0|nr:uncharacterized protein J4E84_000757 [Alternaria hordeiaustralica]KAI4697625.1 hypothetical protein J4E84_000757 [Alternaria hordeiaustralica]